MNNTAYFDNAATTFPKPEEVYRFMDSFYRECGVNVGRGQYKLAARAAALVTETRKMLLDLNHCPNKAVVFTPTATEALNIILNGVIQKDKMSIYLSPFEHNAVVRVINHLAQAFTLKIINLAFDKVGFTYDLEKIGYQFFEDKPDVVVISHASNVCGVVAPIKEICALSKPHGAVNVIDMAEMFNRGSKKMEQLKESEQRVLTLRFGLDDNYEHTLEEIGGELDITRERARQIEVKALRKLRKKFGMQEYWL